MIIKVLVNEINNIKLINIIRHFNNIKYQRFILNIKE